jgi:uncharacterized OB-fold protein
VNPVDATRPRGEPLVAGLFEVRPDGRVVLLGHRCHVCGTPGFPRRDTCGTCGSGDPDEVVLGASGGSLFGWTEVTTAPPGYAGPVPYWFGIVELDDGLRVVGRLVVPSRAGLTFGQRMVCTLDAVPVGETPTPRSGPGNEPEPTRDRPQNGDVVVWAFAPAPGGAG